MEKRDNLLIISVIFVTLILVSLIFSRRIYNKNYVIEYDDSVAYSKYDENIKELKK